MKTATLSVHANPSLRVADRPVKLFYRIQEVARMTGLKPSVLRYWETEFRELRPEKDAADQRRYRQADIEVVLAIRKLLYEDRFTIKGARPRLREELRRVRGQDEAAVALQAVPAPPDPALASQLSFLSVEAPERKRLRQTLKSLRSEVTELLSILS